LYLSFLSFVEDSKRISVDNLLNLESVAKIAEKPRYD